VEPAASIIKAEERFQGDESKFRRNVDTFLWGYMASHVRRHTFSSYGLINTIIWTVELGIVSDHVMLYYVVLCVE
jgi:hypothetical protein